jgi:anti-sigma factor RsiW
MTGWSSGDVAGAEHPGDLLSALLDDELTADAAAAVEGHVEGCPACRTVLDDRAAARTLLRSLPPVSPPADFTRRLVERRRRANRRGGALALMAAAVAVLAGLAMADPAGDAAPGPRVPSLTSENPQLDTSVLAGPLSLPRVEPGAADSADDPGDRAPAPADGGGPSVGDRLDEVTTSLLDLLGG